jgi:hypothetical protein
MNEPTQSKLTASSQKRDFLFWTTLLLVCIGLVNAIPGIPGLDTGLRDITGLKWLSIRRFPTEWFYPLAFAWMMLCVVLKHSMWKAWVGASTGKRLFGGLMDVAMVLGACIISVTYVVEIESICLIDQITGERQRLIAEALLIELEIADTMGLPAATTVEDPSCVGNTGGWLVLIVGLTVMIFLAYNVKVWGLPLVLVALIIAVYTIATVLVWYFHGPDDINKYLMTKLAGEPRFLSDGRPKVHDIHDFPLFGARIAFWHFSRWKISNQTSFSLDTPFTWRPSTCRDRVLCYVWKHFRRTNCQCALYWCSDDPDDVKKRFFQGICWWG